MWRILDWPLVSTPWVRQFHLTVIASYLKDLAVYLHPSAMEGGLALVEAGERAGIMPWFVAFANFPGINTPTMAKFKLPAWCHWKLSWEETVSVLHTMDSPKQTQPSPSTPLVLRDFKHTPFQYSKQQMMWFHSAKNFNKVRETKNVVGKMTKD